jgi:anaerobic dimethyl sulfoxide reductase subunit C (anchor subunit)/Tat-targeted selenate reductase subunit YnfH
MEQAWVLSELPLAIFSTLAPLGAGAFVLLAVAFWMPDFDARQLRRIDGLSIIPLAVVLCGFIAAFFHLASPIHALGVFAGIGRSPLSNEILAGTGFLTLAGSYWLATLTGRLSLLVRRVWLLLVALAALTFAAFIGIAYAVPTIPSWDNPFSPVAVVGHCLLGGSVLGLFILKGAGVEVGGVGARSRATSAAGTGAPAVSSPRASGRPLLVRGALILVLVGSLAALAGVSGQFLLTSTLSGTIVDGSAIATETAPWFIAFVAGVILTAVLASFATLRKTSTAAFAGVVIIATATVFVGRLVFYALQVPVGL